MNRKFPIAAGCAVLITVGVGAPLRAHECPGAPSDELITGLLSGRGGALSLVPGALPEDLRTSLSLPEGARMVGSAVQEDLTRVVAVVPLAGTAARRAVEAALTKRYWSLPPDEGAPEGGFVSSDVLRSVSFCGQKGDVLTGWLSKHPNGSLLTLHYVRSAPGECGGSDRPRRPRRALEQLFPRLLPPEDATWRGSGGGGSGTGEELGDTRHRNTVLEVDLPPAELAEHFGRQLAAAGWQLDAVAAGTVSSVQVWLYRGDEARLIGELTTATVGAGKVVASFKVTRAAPADEP